MSARQTLWAQARTGDLAALRQMVQWLLTVRQNTDRILGSPLVDFIYVDPARWHFQPMVYGTFEDGTPIVDPDTRRNLGVWHATDGEVHKAPPHLNHFHIEMKKRSNTDQ